jgi:hypothetical protein
VALWVVFLRRQWEIGKDVAFYSMLAVSALLGTSLRNTLRLLQDESARFDSRLLLQEATAGILIAFGFALLYLAGGIVITGAVVSLTTDPDFMRVAIIMSILGFASAFLLREAATVLQERLMTQLKNGKPTD